MEEERGALSPAFSLLAEKIESGVCGEILRSAAAGKRPAVYDLCDGQRSFLCAMAVRSGRKVLYVAANRRRAEKLCADVRACLGTMDARVLAGGETLFVGGVSGQEDEKARVEWMTRLACGSLQAVFAVPEDLMQPMMAMAKWQQSAVTLEAGQGIALEDLRARLQEMGYERREMVEDEGQ